MGILQQDALAPAERWLTNADEDKEIIYALCSLNVPARQAELYKIIVELGEAGLHELGLYPGIKPGLKDSYTHLNGLVKRDLAELASRNPIRYRAVPPQEVLKRYGAFNQMGQEEVRSFEKELDMLQSRWKSISLPKNPYEAKVPKGVRIGQAIEIIKEMKGGVTRKNIKSLSRTDFSLKGIHTSAWLSTKLKRRLLDMLDKGELDIYK